MLNRPVAGHNGRNTRRAVAKDGIESLPMRGQGVCKSSPADDFPSASVDEHKQGQYGFHSVRWAESGVAWRSPQRDWFVTQFRKDDASVSVRAPVEPAVGD